MRKRGSRLSGILICKLAKRIAVIPSFENARSPSQVAFAAALLFATGAQAAEAPPIMSVPGQFNVSPQGAATYSIPIAVPPGTAGMAPSISLDYSSQNGNGVMGPGWAVSGLPSIGRCPKTLAQDNQHGGVNFDTNDRFCLEGRRLVAIVGSYGADQTVYRTESEGFSKIVSYGAAGGDSSNGPSYFKVWTKSGQILEFGNGPNSQVLATGSAVVRIWAVNKISDTVGNYLTITYNSETGTDRTTYGQAYPLEIDYTANDAAALGPYNSVRFVYSATPRLDTWPTYQAGSLQQTTVLLTNIKTYLGTSASQTQTLVHDYRLGYDPGTATRYSELTSVTLCDNSGLSTKCLKPTSFTWQGTRDIVSVSDPVPTAISNGNDFTSLVQPADFNGDGLLDAFPHYANTACGIFLATSAGSFVDGNYGVHYPYTENNGQDHHGGTSCMAEVDWAPPDVLISPVDINGDGFADLSLSLTVGIDDGPVDNPAGYFPINDQGTVISGQASQVSPPYTLGQLGDFDGDGRTDFLGAVGPSYYFFSDGSGVTFTQSPAQSGLGGLWATRIPVDFDGDGCSDVMVQGHNQNPIVRLSYKCAPHTIDIPIQNWIDEGRTITLGDFNGDGKVDVLSTKYGVGPGLHFATARGFADASWTNDTGYDLATYSIYTGDFNGDGRTDLLLVADGIDIGGGHHHHAVGEDYHVLLSTGKGFKFAVSIPYVGDTTKDAPRNSLPAVRADIGDWNSDGAADVWIMKPSGDQIFTVTFAPEYIVNIANGIGASTQVHYDRINKNGSLYKKCPPPNSSFACGQTYPTQFIDGPIYVVDKVDVSNGIGGTFESTYAYGQAQADLKGRGFLGFSHMSVTDVQTGIIQTTEYATAFPLTGLVLSQTKVCPAGTCVSTKVTLNDTTNHYDVFDLGQSTDGVERMLVELRSSDVESQDVDSSNLPSVLTAYTYDCDDGSCAGPAATSYGNVLTVAQTTQMPNGNDSTTATTTNTYDNDTSNNHWYLGRLRSAIVETVSSTSDITRHSNYGYDTGHADSTGLLTSEAIEPHNPNCNVDGSGYGTPMDCRLQTDYTYDTYGNKTSATSTGLGAVLDGGNQALEQTTRQTQSQFYDASSDPHAQFLIKATNALNEFETWSYNLAYGTPATHVGPNGLQTTWSYDSYGRKTREHRPDTTETQTAYDYCPNFGGAAAHCPTIASFAVTSTPTQKTSGGVIGAQIGPQAVTYYDSLYRVIATDMQGFNGKWIRAETNYDPLGRLLRTSRPYFRDDGVTVYWTTNTAFDAVGRVLTVTKPYTGGLTSTTDTSYSGLKTTVTLHITKPDGSTTDQTTTTKRNARGLTILVTNAANKDIAYTYDAVGDLLTVQDSAGNITTNYYDVRGKKITAKDPDMGIWHYRYDAFGELYQQTDAKSQTATLSYDLLGRAVKRGESGLASAWTYGTDQGSHNIDKLIKACTNTCGPAEYTRNLTYDSKARPKTVTLNIAGGSAATYTLAYDADTGRVSSLTYPSGLKLRYNYDATLGYLTSITDFASGAVYWTINARDAELHLTAATAGDGMAVANQFDAAIGLVAQITASSPGGTNDLANYKFAFDSNGTLMSRTDKIADGAAPYTENFCYDPLNRVIHSAVGGLNATDCQSGHAGTIKTVAYDDVGNITTKSDLAGSGTGNYTYPSPGGAPGSHPHAVTAINGTVNGTANPKYLYDANGNLTCEFVLTSNCGTGTGVVTAATWTSFNMVAQITQGSTSMALTYDTEHARITQHTVDGSGTTDTTYLNDPMSGAMAEKVVTGSTTTWHDYVMADGKMVAEHFKTGSSQSWNYFVLDHLGSVSVITTDDGHGNPVLVANGHQSYDAWGRRRNADGSDDTTCTKSSTTTRGFTGQEMMPAVCLINFNARIYDPTLGRFLSPDSVTQSLYDMQVFNRYSYCGNNPLSFTDPTGNLFGIDDLLLAAIVVAVAASAIVPEIGDLAPILASVACGPAGPVCAGAAAAAVAGVQGGDVGQIFSAFVFTTFEATMFRGIGSTSWSLPEKALGEGLVGGAVSMAQGGHFGSGFLSAGFSTLTAPVAGEIAGGDDWLGRAINATLGGASSVLGGGKFANGAVTGAFTYAANSQSEQDDTDVSAAMRPDGTIDITKYPYQPTGPVLNDAKGDAWAVDLASHTYISPSSPASEISDILTPSGETVPGASRGNSASTCPGAIIACYHDHPLERMSEGTQLNLRTNQPWRLGFGPDDYKPLLKGAPNYMLNYERMLQVLIYTPAGGYKAIPVGKGPIPYIGPN